MRSDQITFWKSDLIWSDLNWSEISRSFSNDLIWQFSLSGYCMPNYPPPYYFWFSSKNFFNQRENWAFFKNNWYNCVAKKANWWLSSNQVQMLAQLDNFSGYSTYICCSVQLQLKNKNNNRNSENKACLAGRRCCCFLK